MAAELITLPFRPVINTRGVLEPGALLDVFQAGTTTRVSVFSDSDLSVELSNPVVADASGVFPTVYFQNTQAVRVRVRQANGTVIGDADPYYSDGLSSTDLSFLQSGTGAVSRTVQAKLRDTVSLKDFGAVGDGVANDTAAVLAAVDYIEATGNPVYVPAGIYLTDPFQTASQAFALQGFFYGEEPASTVFRRRGTGAGAFITVGDPAATVFQAQILIRGIMIDGGPITNGPAFETYDLVRSRIEDMIFSGGSRAFKSNGGITITFEKCTFQLAARGMEMVNHASLVGGAGGGFPNHNRFNNCQFVDNTQWGATFDGGMVCVFKGCQIEGNGTTLAANEGGLLVGTNVGTEIAVVDALAMGVVLDGCWFEGNKGTADVVFGSGINAISNSNFYSVGTGITNDIKIDGGKYRLRNLNFGHAKTFSVLEGASVARGNIVEYCDGVTISYNSTKTSVSDGFRTFLGAGAVASVNGGNVPLILVGNDATGVNPTVTFNQPFKLGTTPKIYTQAINNSSGTVDQIEVYAVSRTGFTMRKKSFDGATIGTVNYSVDWMAVGESPDP